LGVEWRRYIYTKFLMGRLKERDHLESLSIDEKMLLIWMINTVDGKV
jgi:hypothetical protein